MVIECSSLASIIKKQQKNNFLLLKSLKRSKYSDKSILLSTGGLSPRVKSTNFSNSSYLRSSKNIFKKYIKNTCSIYQFQNA